MSEMIEELKQKAEAVEKARKEMEEYAVKAREEMLKVVPKLQKEIMEIDREIVALHEKRRKKVEVLRWVGTGMGYSRDKEKRQCLISVGEVGCKCESCRREKGKYTIAIVDGEGLLWEACLGEKCFNAFAEASAHYILE